MNEDLYTAVDTYLDDLFDPTDPAIAAALEHCAAAGLPAINVSPNLGRFLHVLALARSARFILEIGTLGGYSAIWLARALPPDGKLISLEVDSRYAEVARHNIQHAGLANRIEVRVGLALDLLAELEHQGVGPFDMIFIDADKPPYADYFNSALRLSHPGTLIVADNVIRGGKVARRSSDEAVRGIQRFNAALAANPRVAAAVVQLVGVKGHDGMAIAVVRDDEAIA